MIVGNYYKYVFEWKKAKYRKRKDRSMRRTTIIMFIVLILTLGGTCLAAVNIYDTRDEVTLTKISDWGSKELLNGLSMQLHMTYMDRLHWNTVIPMDHMENAATEYDFSIRPVYADWNRYTGLTMDTSIWMSDFLADNGNIAENAEGLGQIYQELAEITDSNKETKREIWLKDYIDYYHYNIEIDIPGTKIDSRVNSSHKIMVQEQEKYAMQKLREFFKIPVLEEEHWQVSLGKDENGNIIHSGSSNGSSDFFYMWTFNAIARDCCYFTFGSHSEEGVVMDTSQIPGGYGIYYLPYDGTLEGKEETADKISIDVDGLKMVYSLEPEIDVMHLHLNEKMDKLILHAEEYGEYVVTVIDVATMETLQKISVMDWDKDYGYQIYDEEDFIVTTVHKTQEEGKIEAVVIDENENREYEVAFICDIQNKELPSFNTSMMYLNFDGKRLAMSGFMEEEEQGYQETCNVFLAVCDASGMQYYGEYRNSLETGYDADRYNFRCQGGGLEPIVLKWK